MLKKIGLALLGVLVLVLGAGLYFGMPYLNIASSYAAKNLCSGVFVAKRSADSLRAEDLHAVSFTSQTVDEIGQSVSANVFGLAPTKAIYREGLGCSLVNEITESEIRTQPSVTLSRSTPIVILEKSSNPALETAIQSYFVDAKPEEAILTRAIVVMQNGKIIGEKYANGYSPTTPLLGWSMTKSVTNAMIGMLVLDAKLEVNKGAPVEEWQSDDRKDITLDNLLRMSSGLAFVEDYASPSDATRMLFQKKDAGAYAIASKLGAKPGSVWSYSSGTTNILQEIIRRQFSSHADYLAFPHKRLFEKLGMNSAILEPDASGTYVGSSFMYATARDWAKFGQLYAQDGLWNGERILPKGWAAYSSSLTPNSNGEYGAQFWLNKNDQAFPKDAFMAEGFEGQNVTIIPSRGLVLVRLGMTYKGEFNDYEFVKRVVATIK
jgi:CubicO group peptidase (beta-lactamase class C family)